MVCDECEIRSSCPILKHYLKNDEFIKTGNIEAMEDLYNLLEIHEAYLSEMRKNILIRTISMRQQKLNSI